MDTAGTLATRVREQVGETEWQVRKDLAALYRLVALFGWDDLIFTHITAKVPGTEHFLINPYGMMFDEITASSLVKIDLDGRKVMESAYDINPAGFTIHSCIHAARKDAMCVLHTHSINGVAVSAQKDGLLPLSQFAFIALRSLAYHDYEGLALNPEEQPRLVRDLGASQYLILRNHGLLTVGQSMAEAFQAMHRLEAACMVQVRAQAGGGELTFIPPEVLARAAVESPADRAHKAALAWPGLLRRLDRRNPGYAD
ncbi:class II aldolase/adducin family protein [Achromobacter xylosoxidans]|uniref:class II aldolase/adducin family protein n=1 Tax=Alcaligenes xylosoxydans xylosoxydans TaxID=85698 RepID=UPI0008A2F810|nr:class II aldolase/adducin family protein [Achromobacter xylosoxidans]OFQ42641.1 class II aldolase [Achromobacter xylosoxidans]